MLIHVQLFVTAWTPHSHVSLSFTISWSLFKVMSIELVTSSKHLILCHTHLFLSSIFLSIRVFSNEIALRIWYWSFSCSSSPSNEYSGLFPVRFTGLISLISWGTLKSLPQYHSSKVSILQCSAFFMVQHSHLYMAIKKKLKHWLHGSLSAYNVSVF